MAPTLPPGTKVTIDYTAFAMSGPKRWDVIAFNPPDAPDSIWIARVVAFPGETVAFDTNGLVVNGQAAVLPAKMSNVTYVAPDHPTFGRSGTDINFPYQVPAESFFVLGDNSMNANDSRFWGALNGSNLLGRVKGL